MESSLTQPLAVRTRKPRPSYSFDRRNLMFAGQVLPAFRNAEDQPSVRGKLRTLGWNNRVLTYDDFLEACQHECILRIDRPLPVGGFFFIQQGYPVIGLAANLQGVERNLVAWHEFGHFALHNPPVMHRRRPCHLVELEADSVAYGALIPRHLLHSYSAEEIAAGLGYPLKLVKTRFRIFRHFNL